VQGVSDDANTACCSRSCSICLQTSCALRSGGTNSCCPYTIVAGTSFCDGLDATSTTTTNAAVTAPCRLRVSALPQPPAVVANVTAGDRTPRRVNTTAASLTFISTHTPPFGSQSVLVLVAEALGLPPHRVIAYSAAIVQSSNGEQGVQLTIVFPPPLLGSREPRNEQPGVFLRGVLIDALHAVVAWTPKALFTNATLTIVREQLLPNPTPAAVSSWQTVDATYVQLFTCGNTGYALFEDCSRVLPDEVEAEEEKETIDFLGQEWPKMEFFLAVSAAGLVILLCCVCVFFKWSDRKSKKLSV
jgi:hypothetical protein